MALKPHQRPDYVIGSKRVVLGHISLFGSQNGSVCSRQLPWQALRNGVDVQVVHDGVGWLCCLVV